MSFISEIGDAVETHGELSVEWRINNFLSLSEKPDDFYCSPVFSYADSFWHLILYPNGQTRNQSTGWIDLYLARKDSGSPKTVVFTIWIKGSDAEEISLKSRFLNSLKELGHLKFFSRSELLKNKEKIMPSSILTINCKLKCADSNTAGISLNNRLRKVSRNLKSFLTDAKSADFTLRCKNREWPVHKMILGSRCEYFESMFRHEWLETTAGEVKFSDINEDVLESILNFIYTGEVEDLSDSNVHSIYVTAHLFLLKDLKELCIEYMKRNMGTDVVCDALDIAHTYEEGDLKTVSMEFLVENADDVMQKEEWKHLKEKNPDLVIKILEKTALQGALSNKKIKLMQSASTPARRY